MKKGVFLILLILLTGPWCRGQSPVLPLFAFQKQLTLKRVTARTFLIPAVGIQKGNNMILAGPVIRIAQLDNALSNKPILTGIQLSEAYFFPNKKNSRLQFYAVYFSKYQEIEEEWTGNFWAPLQKQYIDYEAENEETIWENSLGAGISWNFHRKLRLDSSIGLGYYLSFTEWEEPEESFNPSQNKDYRGYRNNGLFYSFQIGVTYKFNGFFVRKI